jgi:hypothetical protein
LTGGRGYADKSEEQSTDFIREIRGSLRFINQHKDPEQTG